MALRTAKDMPILPLPSLQTVKIFHVSLKEKISLMTPHPYQPGCNISFAQWRQSENNRITAITIRKTKSAVLQDLPRSSFGSSYVAKMNSVAIEHEVRIK